MKIPQPELRRARIEIVPMIDTIFFLLVFFMITSLSMVALRAKKVALPESETAKGRPQNQITVTVDHNQRFFLDQTPLQAAGVDLRARLTTAVQENPSVQVILNVDKDLPLSFFLQVYDAAKRANAAKIMVATSPRSTVSVGGP